VTIRPLLRTSDILPASRQALAVPPRMPGANCALSPAMRCVALRQLRRTMLIRYATPARISTAGQKAFTPATPPRPTISRNTDHT
jgi:hypothetical protein